MKLFTLTMFALFFIALPLYAYTQLLVPALGFVRDSYAQSPSYSPPARSGNMSGVLYWGS